MMPSTPDWEKEAEKKYDREREDIRHESKARFAFYILLVGVVVFIFGVGHLVEWMFDGGNLIPSGSEVTWALGGLAITLAGGYLGERYEEAKSIREQRLIRLEMKIDTLLDRQDRVDSKLADLRDEVRQLETQ
jgi:hypothetical protein